MVRSQKPICSECGSEARGNYCGNCGTSMDERTQLHASAIYSWHTEKQRRREVCERLKVHTETGEEKEVLDRIKERI